MNNIELKEIRKKLNLTQTAFAELFEKATMRTIQNWESGTTPVPEYVTSVIEKEIERRNTPFFVNDKNSTKKSDVTILDNDQEVEIFKNKNGVNFYLYPDDSIKIEVSVLPFNAYASSQIECYFDENYINKEFSKIQFTVDKIGKGVYLGFKTKNDSMNGGGLNDTPNGAEVLGREIGRQHWLTLHKNDYGFVLMTKSAIMHKDITSYNPDTGMFTLHSRNPSENDFEVSINDIYRIFNVIKRTF